MSEILRIASESESEIFTQKQGNLGPRATQSPASSYDAISVQVPHEKNCTSFSRVARVIIDTLITSHANERNVRIHRGANGCKLF